MHCRPRFRFSLRTLFVVVTLLSVLVAYTCSYTARSLRGRYEPLIGGVGVKGYIWIPEGFTLRSAYYPLWVLDLWWWHTSDKAYGDAYPTNHEFDSLEIDLH